MNALSLVAILLIILSIATNTLLNRCVLSSKLEKSYMERMELDRKKQNKKEYNHYYKKKGKNNSRSKKEKTKIENLKEKLNFYSLFKNGKEKSPELYNLFNRLLLTFYKNSFSSQKEAEAFTNRLLQAANKKEELYLEKIDLKDDSLQLLFYRMLKGTKYYSLENNAGILPLSNFVCLSQKASKLNFFKTPKEILILLFNEKIANELFLKKNNIKTKEDLESILDRNHFQDRSCLKLLYILAPVEN